MYAFKNTKTGKTHSYSTISQAMRAKDRQDRAYGAVCTTYPAFVAK